MPRYTGETLELMKNIYDEGGIPNKELANRMVNEVNVSRRVAVGYINARENGFESLSDLQRAWAKSKGHKSHYEYQRHRAEEQGLTIGEYQASKDEQRRQRPVNQIVAALINTWSSHPGNSRHLLARELGTTEGTVRRYANGSRIPRRNLQPKFFETLGLPYRSVDEMLALPNDTTKDLIGMLEEILNESNDR